MKELLKIKDNHVTILNATNSEVVAEFLRYLKGCITQEYTEIRISISPNIATFPNVITPICSLINYYAQNSDIKFVFVEESTTHIFKTELISEDNAFVLNKIWHFKSYDEVFHIQIAFINELQKQDAFAPDVLNSLEWSLNEIMDNVIQHSAQNTATNEGFIMGQIHKTSRHIAFCICDTGIGIYNSLKNSVHAPKNAQEALTFAVKKGITRDKKMGQGNGMYGLHEIVKLNKGRLAVHSNGAIYRLINDETTVHNGEPTISAEIGCTMVDFQLDYANSVSIQNVFPNTSSHINTRLEHFENDNGETVYTMKEQKYGYGTRVAGQMARNEVINFYNSTKTVILIDFQDIKMVSSSFADEFIGKLVLYLGFFGFNNIIKLRNMNENVQAVVQHSVSQRLAESLNSL